MSFVEDSKCFKGSKGWFKRLNLSFEKLNLGYEESPESDREKAVVLRLCFDIDCRL